MHANGRAIRATVPLVDLLGYEPALAALTAVRAIWSMEFRTYVPASWRAPDPMFPGAAAARVA